jgi:hypothetical protein
MFSIIKLSDSRWYHEIPLLLAVKNYENQQDDAITLISYKGKKDHGRRHEPTWESLNHATPIHDIHCRHNEKEKLVSMKI